MFFFLLFSVIASPLEEGDALWAYPTYHKAIQKWKEAKQSHEQAISIMAQYRLLLVSSDIMLPFHLIRADQELGQCDLEDPRCILARIDREIIFATLGYPIQSDFIEELLTYIQDNLPKEAHQRKQWLAYQSAEHSSPSESVTGPITRGPGSPSISVGLFYGIRQGIGTHLGYRIPNIDHRLGDLSLYLSIGTTDYGRIGFRYNRVHPIWIKIEADLRNVNYFRFQNDEWEILPMSSTHGSISFGYQHGTNHFWIGPQFRWEQLDTPIAAHGFNLGFQIGPDHARLNQRVEGSFSSYTHIRSTTTIQYKHPIGFGVQLNADLCPDSEAPWWRLPSAGGGLYLRLPFAQRIRSQNLYTGTLEWQLFPKQTLGGVIFAEGASGKNIYAGAGVGARIRLPPSPNNNLRLDVGYSTLGWGIYADIGEQF